MAKRKPVLVEVDSDRWERAKARAALLGTTVSLFTDDALKAALGELTPADTEAVAQNAARVVNEVISTVANYVSSPNPSSNYVSMTTTEPSGTQRLLRAATPTIDDKLTKRIATKRSKK